jgi:hypothetical protein
MKPVVIALGLLAAATSASADCAWVLWEQLHTTYTLPGRPEFGPVVWTIVAAKPAFSQCNQDAATEVDHQDGKWRRLTTAKVEKLSSTRLVIVVEKPQDEPAALEKILDAQYKCLPDTVDPRGAKGAER